MWVVDVLIALIEPIIVLLGLHFEHHTLAARVLSVERQAELDAKLKHSEELRRQISTRNKIKAIKLYREETGAGLKEAKLAVEKMEAEMRTERGDAQHAYAEEMDEVQRFLRADQKIHAIKAYRQKTGVGLKEAKRAVERMVAEGGEKPVQVQIQAQAQSGLVDPEKLQGLIREGRKLEAIKYFRQQRGMGLKEAKDAVDWLEARMRQEQ